MIFGTHNSATGGELLWWLKPFKKILDLTSKCQDRTIEEQLNDGVKYFNLQITRYRGDWVLSHGLAIYREKLLPTLELMAKFATPSEPILFNLYLDDNIILGQPCEEFRELITDLMAEYNGREGLTFHYAWIENSNEFFRNGVKVNMEEHYWSLGWAKCNAESMLDCFPLPKRHALKYNKAYKENCKSKYLILDYYNL